MDPRLDRKCPSALKVRKQKKMKITKLKDEKKDDSLYSGLRTHEEIIVNIEERNQYQKLPNLG